MTQGYLALVLHAHLPYIRHAEHEEFLEEDWLFEAITETYLPLILSWQRMAADNTPFALTISLTPPLLEMLADPLLQDRYARYLQRRCELMEREITRTRHHGDLHRNAHFYAQRFRLLRAAYEDQYHRDLIAAFRQFQQSGHIEILTCAATHGFLPLMSTPNGIHGQLATAVRAHKRHLGVAPRGIWLPECAYRAGLDAALAQHGLTHFIADTHAILNGHPPAQGAHLPARTPGGPAVFVRDIESSRQVWSSQAGYPGDVDYREFYRDLGYDGDYASIRPCLHADGIRRSIGVKYHRVTGKVDLGAKALYNHEWAQNKAREHARHYLRSRQEQILGLRRVMTDPPVVVAPYDAELFGHWWFEGPDFLEQFFRHAQYVRADYEPTTLTAYLQRHNPRHTCAPSSSSWGAKGYYGVWLNNTNDWIYRYLHHAEERMARLARALPRAAGHTRAALNQAARELLLAQSSDWAFIMTNNTSVPYAHRRTREHITRFHTLCDMVEAHAPDPQTIDTLWRLDPIFPDVNYRDWR